jgi:hypothetical protein
MKYLVFIVFLLFGCVKPDPPVDTSPNVLFYSTGVSRIIQIKGIGGQYIIEHNIKYPNPSCMTTCSGVLTMYLKEGTYDIVVLTPSGSIIKKIQTYDGGCERFDVNF